MKNKLFFAVLTLGVILLVASGCQKVPQAQLDLAKAAVDSAKSVQADRYLSAEFIAVQDTLNMADNTIETMKSASFFKRNYKGAAAQLDWVKTNADVLITNTLAKKEEVKMQAEAAVIEVNALIAENKELVKKAPKGKEGKAAIELIQQDITMIENTVTSAQANLAEGDYLSALDRLNAAKEAGVRIKTELQTAIDKYKKR